MTDVLDQLRFIERSASLAAASVIKTAADEIEQLRELNIKIAEVGLEQASQSERLLAEWTSRLTAQAAEIERLRAKIEQLRAALDAFATATGMPDGPSLAVQRHDPSWAAWTKLCDVAQQTAGL